MTLVALFMAGAAMADSYLYMDDMTVSVGQVTVPVKASFDGRVSGFLLDVTYPEGLTPVSAEAGPCMTLNYMDSNGVQRIADASFFPNTALDRFIGVTMDFGYWDPNGTGVYEKYGVIKWEAGEYDEMFYLTFDVGDDFQGGEILLETQVSGGEDARGGTVDELGELQVTFPSVCTVELEPAPLLDLTGDIVVSEVEEYGMVYIFYTGDEDVTMTVMVNGMVVEMYNEMLQLPDYGTSHIEVTVEADGYNPKYYECDRNWERPISPVPVITWEITDDYVMITAIGEGEVRLYIDGDQMPNPCQMPRGDVDYTVEAFATAQIDNYFPAETGATILIPAKETEPLITPMPSITSVVSDDAVTITAEGDGTVLLYIDGIEVSNPCVLPRGDEDYEVTAQATAQNDNWEISETADMLITIPAKVVEPGPVTGTFFSMEGGEILHGNTIVIPVSLTNEEAVTAFQADLYLPEGFELIDTELSDRAVNHNLMTSNRADGSIRILCYSATLASFKGNEGVLFYLTLKAPEEAGEYTLTLKKNIVTTNTYTEVRCDDASCTVNVLPYLKGDANGSGSVTIADASVTANYILELNPDPFIFGAADMNEDGEITITDVVLIASIVLDPTGNTIFHAPARGSVNNDLMSGEGCNLAIGETRTVTIALDNAMNYTAFQLNVQLPDGLTASNFRLTDRAGSHALTSNMTADGKQRLLCYSPTLSVIDGHEGALLTFDVTATGNIYGDIMVDGIEMVTAACQTVYLNSFSIEVGNSATSLKELAGDLRIYTDGKNIIIDSPVAQRMMISDVAGRSYSVEVEAGHNVFPARTSGVVIVSNGEKTSKLMLK